MNRTEIGEFIKQKRLESQLSQAALAKLAGVRRQSILEIENSQYDFRVDTLLKILNALDLDLIVSDRIVSYQAVTYNFKNIKI